MSEQRAESREQRAQSREYRAASTEQRTESTSLRQWSSLLAARCSLLSALCSLLITSCNPWHFALQQHTGWDIEGKIYDHKQNVNVVSGNTIVVEAPAKVAVRCYQITDGLFEAEVTLFNRASIAADDEVIFHFRSTPYEDTVLSRTEGDFFPSLFAVVVSNEYAAVYHRDTSYAWRGIMPEPGTPFRLRVVQHGRFVDVDVACTDLGTYQTDNATTQWVSIAPQGSQRVEIRDPIFRPLSEVYPGEAQTQEPLSPFLR